MISYMVACTSKLHKMYSGTHKYTSENINYLLFIKMSKMCSSCHRFVCTDFDPLEYFQIDLLHFNSSTRGSFEENASKQTSSFTRRKFISLYWNKAWKSHHFLSAAAWNEKYNVQREEKVKKRKNYFLLFIMQNLMKFR
jgi:hypothetical protein